LDGSCLYNEKRALISFFIQNTLAIAGIFYAGLHDIPYSDVFIRFIAPVSAFLFFGYDYFKNYKGLWLGVLGLMLSEYNSIFIYLNDIVEMLGFRDMFYYSGDTVSFNYIDDFFNSFVLIIDFGVFWIILNYMKSFKNQKYDFSFRKLIPFNIEDKVTFSVVFWLFRIVISFLMFKGLVFVEVFNNSGMGAILFFKLTVVLIVKTYVFGSLYRNFMVSYFLQRNHYPSWFYYVLNIPILNVIAWTIFMFQSKDKNNVVKDDVLDKFNEVESVTERFQKLKAKFTTEKRNESIKALYYIIIIFSNLYLFVTMIKHNNFEDFGTVIILFFVSLAVITLYLNDSRGLFFILIFYFSVFLIGENFQIKELIEVVSMASIMNLIIFYPLFHFDQFSYIDKEEEKIEPDLIEE